MQSTRDRLWRISIHAKGKQFDFRFKARNLLPQSKDGGKRFSVVLRLRKFLLKVNSDTGDSVGEGKRCRSTWKLVRAMRKFLPTRVGDEAAIVKPDQTARPVKQGWRRFLPEELIPSIAGNLALLSYSVTQKDHWGLVIQAFTLLFFGIMLLKNLRKKETHSLLVQVVSAASFLGFAVIYLNCQLQFPEAYWKAWKHIFSILFLNTVSHVIMSRFSVCIERNKSIGLVLSSLLTLLLQKVKNPWNSQAFALFAPSVWFLVKKATLFLYWSVICPLFS